MDDDSRDDLRMEHFLRRRLYAWDCPPEQTLGDYHLQLLPQADAEPIAAHIADCPRCQRTLRQLAEFMRLPEAAETTASPTLTLLPPRQRSSERRPLELFPTLAKASGDGRVRGLFGDGVILFTVGTVSVFLQTEMEGKQVVVRGRVTDEEDPARWQDARVEVRQSGNLIDATVIDSFGGFTCTLQKQESFALRIRALNGISIVIDGVT